MKKFTLLLFVIALVACNTAEKQTTVVAEPEPAVESAAIEESDVSAVADNVPAQANDMPAEPVMDIDTKYLITNQGAGVFLAGEEIPTEVDGYKIAKETELVVHPDSGSFTVGVYVVSENGKDVLSLDSNGIEIISDKFKTNQNIGLGSTIEEFVTAYPDFEIKCTPLEYSEDYYCDIKTDQLSKVRFSLDENDVISREKLTFEYYHANNGKLEPSDFKKGAKIKIFIFS